jgi:predicted nucleotidyltransferase
MIQATKELLSELVEAIVREVSPEKIFFFGSRSRGDNRKDSDFDLLIVEREPFGPTRSRWKEMTRIIHLAAALRIPADVLLYSTQEYEQWRNTKSHIISRAVHEGILLYEGN